MPSSAGTLPGKPAGFARRPEVWRSGDDYGVAGGDVENQPRCSAMHQVGQDPLVRQRSRAGGQANGAPIGVLLIAALRSGIADWEAAGPRQSCVGDNDKARVLLVDSNLQRQIVASDLPGASRASASRCRSTGQRSGFYQDRSGTLARVHAT